MGVLLVYEKFHQYAPPPDILPVVQKIKNLYLLWHSYHQILPKIHKYTIGAKIDNLLAESIEAVVIASFLSREEKLPYVRLAIRKIDTVKIFFLMLWEAKSLENKKYIAISEKVSEVGKMLGGWSGQLLKQNSPK
jgi:hypothetical protein